MSMSANGESAGAGLIGASGADPKGGEVFSDDGASYVIFGKAGGFGPSLDLSVLNGRNGFKLSGEAQSDRSGFSVASAGDINGDGFDDVIVGAPGNQYGDSGPSYVVFGKANGFKAEFDLSSLNGRNGFQINGEAMIEGEGTSVASAGDVNGDGFDDIIIGAAEKFAVYENPGTSYVVFGRATGAITRVGTAEDEFLAGGDFADDLDGAGGDDRLMGGGKDDVLTGGRGDDILDGGSGGDVLMGGGGKDALTGGIGADELSGGAGDDRFILELAGESKAGDAQDRIADFGQGGDRIDLRSIDADSGRDGDQAFAFLSTSDFTGAGGELRFDQTRRDTIVSGDLNGDGVADFQIRLDGLVALDKADFLL